MKKVVIVSLATLACVACGKGRSNNPIAAATQTARAPELQGSWQAQNCTPLVFKGLETRADAATEQGKNPVQGIKDAASITTPKFERVEYIFKGDSVTRKTVWYADAEGQNGCKDELVRFEERGSMDIETDKSKNTQDGGRLVVFKFEKLMATPVGDKGVQLANAIRLCEASDWQNDKQKDVTSHSANEGCYGVKEPHNVYNAFKVEGDKLTLGTSDIKENKAQNRPTKLESDKAYLKH